MNDINYARWQKNKIKKSLKTRRVIILAGARQSGKTTLAKELSKNDSIYRTLDDVALLEAALNDPHGFVKHNDQLMIIDEVQRAPNLLQAVKRDVDENQKPGRFLLTGSANIQSLPGVRESLAGRVRKIRLRTLSMGEIEGGSKKFIKSVFSGDLQKIASNLDSKYDKDTYLEKAFAGGYPEPLFLSDVIERKYWHRDYLDALIERDLKDIANISRVDKISRLVEVLAAWSSKFMDISSIARDLSIARSTTESYINSLEALYLVERVRPWQKTDYDRIGKQDKLFITDTGLMSSILNWRLDDVRLNGELNGKLIETFVFNQLAAIIDAEEDIYSIYHYRDREKREIDFIIENENGDILAIEVKAGSAVSLSSFKHIKWFENNIVNGRKCTGIVLYTGRNVASFAENLLAVPIHFLWALS